MRFYVPEWDDAVDGAYDFIHDEHSTLNRSERSLQYIWDTFEYDSVPIDGVLISREKVEESTTKFERFKQHGVYDDPVLDIPEWLPTISDCGAWGYKSLPFPPYDTEEMLDFYSWMDVDIGVTIDHLVLGSGKGGRLYLNENALGEGVTKSTLPDELTDTVDVMIDEWPGESQKWPDYVEQEEPSIYHAGPVTPFDRDDFEGSSKEIIERLEDDPRAVYREDDTRYRYNLTLRNAEEMKRLYDEGNYSFRLMVAIQGWDPDSYAHAAQRVLNTGYDYIGIGGVAGSGAEAVSDIVSEIGGVVKEHERTNSTRVDSHVFGFAKTDVFDSIGQAGMTSFDSASMLRSAWEGGNNYHIGDDKYAALRVRFGLARDDREVATEKALRGQELLRALRAYGEGQSISEAIERWESSAEKAISGLIDYIDDIRHEGVYNEFDRLRDAKEYFRDDYKHGRELTASFSRQFRTEIIKLLQDDSRGDSHSYHEYLERVAAAKGVYDETFPNTPKQVQDLEEEEGEFGTTRQILTVVENYTHSEVIGDEGHLPDYRELLGDRPWEDCSCDICEEYGIEVAIFRGNNRNRRRGFHNTRQFYDQFERDLPKLAVAAPLPGDASQTAQTEDLIQERYPDFWSAVHDLPVAEIGAVSPEQFVEWWDTPMGTTNQLSSQLQRYESLLLFNPDVELNADTLNEVRASGCRMVEFETSEAIRDAVLDILGYDEEFLPSRHVQTGIADW
jgi:hypothetical protein